MNIILVFLQLLVVLIYFDKSDERQKCAENSDIRFYLVKSLIRYQKVKNFGIYLRLEEFNQCSTIVLSKSKETTIIQK